MLILFSIFLDMGASGDSSTVDPGTPATAGLVLSLHAPGLGALSVLEVRT